MHDLKLRGGWVMNNTKTSRVKVNQDVNGLNNLKKKKSSIEFPEIYNAMSQKNKNKQ